MKVTQINSCDIYREGGSLGLSFIADDNEEYELFLKNRLFEVSPETNFYPPVIYLERSNNGDIIKKLTWEQAKEFIAPLEYNLNNQFEDLVNIINNDGKNKFY